MPQSRPGGSLADLKEHNLSQMLACVARTGVSTREEIRSVVRMHPSSLGRHFEELRSRGLLTERDSVQLTPFGRPTQPIVFATHRWALLGIVVDRHQVQAAVGQLDLTIIESKAFSAPPSTSTSTSGHAEALGNAVSWAVQVATAAGLTFLAAEIDAPGALDRDTGEVHQSLLNGWDKFNLAQTLDEAFVNAGAIESGSISIRIDREANSMAQARLREIGAAPNSTLPPDLKGPTAYFGGRYALSGALYDKGIVRGATGLAGDFGHLPVDPFGEVCWCGRTGCLETKVGLQALRFARSQQQVPLHALSAEGPRMLQQLVAARNAKEPKTLAWIADAGRWVAASIDVIAAVANPARIVIDGYLAQLGEPLMSPLTAQLDRWRSLPTFKQIEVVRADNDSDALFYWSLAIGATHGGGDAGARRSELEAKLLATGVAQIGRAWLLHPGSQQCPAPGYLQGPALLQ